jgi:hypothetical protein
MSLPCTPSLRQRLRAIDVPVLLIQGELDRPVAAVRALASELPRSRFVVLDGVGHFPHREAPDTLQRLFAQGSGSRLSERPDLGPNEARRTATSRHGRDGIERRGGSVRASSREEPLPQAHLDAVPRYRVYGALMRTGEVAAGPE